MSQAVDFDNWRLALAGGKPGIHDGEPWCGYFKIKDRRSDHLSSVGTKRPWVACAIWRDNNGVLVAEMAKAMTSPDRLWPYCAMNPITYEAYQFWHQHERWPAPEEQAA